MRKLTEFLRQYRLFSMALGALFIAAGLVLNNQHTAAHWVLGVAALLAALPLLWDMVQDLRAGAYGVDVLTITSIVVAVILGQYWVAITVMLLLSGSRAVHDYAQRRARRDVAALLQREPRQAVVIRKGKRQTVAVSAVQTGDKIVVPTGTIVPVDGVLLEGSIKVDESFLGGEQTLRTVTAGEAVPSGAAAIDTEFILKATADAEHGRYQQLARLLRSAGASRSPYERLAERYTLPFTFTAFAIAAAAWLISGHAIRFLDVIIVATPAPLLLGASLSFSAGLARAARHGIFARTGAALEQLAEAPTFVFSKTGVLTYGQFSVASVKAYGSFTEDEVLRLSASLAQQSAHPAAAAIVSASITGNLKLAKARHVKEVAGLGIEAHLQGKDIRIGHLRFLGDASMPTKFKANSIQQPAVFVAVDQTLAGVILLEDGLRPEAETTFQQLKRVGVKKFVLLTGDSESSAHASVKALAMHTIHANLTSAGKLHQLEKVAEKDRPLTYVGLGRSDAPVLASADIGIALGMPLVTSYDAADIVIAQTDLARVAYARVIARRTLKIANQSVFGGMTFSLILMALFATGRLSPLIGVFLQAAVGLLVVTNALRTRH